MCLCVCICVHGDTLIYRDEGSMSYSYGRDQNIASWLMAHDHSPTPGPYTEILKGGSNLI